jgi:DNA-binding PadR family transcriptional regulator
MGDVIGHTAPLGAGFLSYLRALPVLTAVQPDQNAFIPLYSGFGIVRIENMRDYDSIQEHLCKGMTRLYVIFALSRKPTHGYLLLKDFKKKLEAVGHPRKTSAGEFYMILDHMEEAGLVESEWVGTGRRKKVFSLTPAGKAIVRTAKKNFTMTLKMFRNVVPELFGGAGNG